jgi:hypothetical protein
MLLVPGIPAQPPAAEPAATPTAAAAPLSFAGLWRTRYGPMRLHLDEQSACAGAYAWNGVNAIRGSVTDQRFEFTYEQQDGERGEGWFELAPDAMSFRGEWRTAGMTAPAQWNGERVLPQPGVTWLVVLEAHWEDALTQPEFSYGEMQRTFFKRLPHVSFRHRFVHDLADLETFCAEVSFIAEPVILYFSSHGTPAGLQIGRSTVTPEQIAAALRGGGNIKLLHFGACAVMGGDAPARLLAALPDSVRFAISGYANTADWAGSAIIDFTYLDLILEHGLSPAAAIAETRESLRFADQVDGTAPGVIPASLLRIHEPAE